MSLNYSFTGEWNGSTKDSVGKWVKQKLTQVQDGEAPEDLFLEYIIVMIGNGKRMRELSHELQDFIGEQKANDFATDLGSFLQSIPISEPAIEVTLPPVQLPIQTATVINSKPNNDILNGGLQSSRSSGPTIQKNARLLDSALRSTTATSSQKRERVAPDLSGSQLGGSVGFASHAPGQNAGVGSSTGGLFTKRGSIKMGITQSINNDGGDALSKKRKVIIGGPPGQQSFPLNQPTNLGIGIQPPNMGRGGEFFNNGMGMGGFQQGPPYPPNDMGGLAPVPMGLDPASMYMEQMNMMARVTGFNSVEDMLFFQQNMMSNMVGGGGGQMPMGMPVRGPSGFPTAENFSHHNAREQHQRGRGYAGRVGGRGPPQHRPQPPSQNSSAAPKTAPPAPPPIELMPVKARIAAVAPVPVAVPPAPIAPAAESKDEQSECAFGYSGGGGPGGFRGRGRGWGRGFGRGGFHSSSEAEFGGRGAPAEYEGGGGRSSHPGRGRGSYRGRGYVPPGAAAANTTGGPPKTFNKVWVREADIENPLVAGR